MAATFSKLNGGTPFSLVSPNNEWSLTTALAVQQDVMALCFREFDLGGSRSNGVDGTGAQDAWEFKYVGLPGADLQGFSAQVRFETWTDAAGTSVTPKIRDVTASSDLATGGAVTALTPTEEVVSFSIPNATRKLKFMLTKSNADALVYGVAKIEILVP